ncbi:MAG: anti-sigma regulatory factor, serine/threonine protein kinase [Firmicutes bacterium]|nr:anti-sigma regulatory factor, serine/threonine protein kinase [Bacillota bacterium]
MTIKNHLKMSLTSNGENVGIARVTAATFAAQAELTLNDIEEIKVAISEAFSNAVIHGYKDMTGEVECEMILTDGMLEFTITDHGKGIADIDLARQPAYSSDPERMGLGFVFMDSFMDELFVESVVDQGTTVRMIKKLILEQAN